MKCFYKLNEFVQRQWGNTMNSLKHKYEIKKYVQAKQQCC